MLPSELVSKPLNEWNLIDLNLIVARQSEESQFLEFKEYMPLNRGSLGWNFGGSLHANERDGLAKEIVAFANAYGGHLIVGIKESQEKPSRAERLGDVNTDVAELAERLRSALNSIIDPPINGLRIQPIISTDTGGGFLAIHVPQSIHAPHGFGKPPEAYVRRADRSEPMTMRDMQNVFWEARTRRERIDAEIAASKGSFAKHAIRDRCVAYAFCAVSNDEIQISDIIQYFRARSGERIPGLFSADPIWTAAYSPANSLKWQPCSRGVTQRFGHDANSPHSKGHWSVDDHGIVSLYGIAEYQRIFENLASPRKDQPRTHHNQRSA